jgi:hypothetical protein
MLEMMVSIIFIVCLASTYFLCDMVPKVAFLNLTRLFFDLQIYPYADMA